ncbi:cytidine deaminase [soil metagenome]
MSFKPAITKFADLKSSDQELVSGAWAASKAAHVPYSKFYVGSVIEAQNAEGTVRRFSGCNVENASYGGAICAERTAAVKAVSEGFTKFLRISVVCATKPGGSPCGICRQFLREFGGLELVILCVQNEESDVSIWKLDDLLPDSFGPEALDF